MSGPQKLFGNDQLTKKISIVTLKQGFPKWAMSDIQGAMRSQFETYNKYSGVADEEKKKGPRSFQWNFFE